MPALARKGRCGLGDDDKAGFESSSHPRLEHTRRSPRGAHSPWGPLFPELLGLQVEGVHVEAVNRDSRDMKLCASALGRVARGTHRAGAVVGSRCAER